MVGLRSVGGRREPAGPRQPRPPFGHAEGAVAHGRPEDHVGKVVADGVNALRRADRAIWPPIPYASTGVDITGDVFEPPSAAHWLGTDALGRDVAAGMIHGTRISLTIGLVVVAIQATIGILLGGLAGFYGGWVDIVLSRLFELMLGIPTFYQLVAKGLLLVLAVAIGQWRLARSEKQQSKLAAAGK